MPKNLNDIAENLNERIGIDKSIVYDFVLSSIDIDRLNYKATYNSNWQYVELSRDDKSLLVLEDGTHLGKLLIKDKKIGKMTISFGKIGLTGHYGIRSSLELTVSGSGNNVQNLSTKEYQARITDVFDYLASEYGVVADYSSLRIRKLELNATFFLAEPYEKYRYPILMIMRNVPPKNFSEKGSNRVKYATWSAADIASQQDRLETALVKNNSVELKIYNKTRWARDNGILLSTDRDLMRIEYTIKDSKILRANFGDNLVSSLSDEKITALFRKYFNRDIASRYYDWAADNVKELTKLVMKHRETEKHWVGYFLRDCRKYAEEHGLPILFDLEDLRTVFRKLEPGRNAAKKFKRFMSQAVFEDDLIGNTRRMKEIINKI